METSSDYLVNNVLVAELIRHSAEEVVKKLPKKKQAEYETLY